MNGYIGNIEKEAEANTDFRRVVFTGPKSQLVLMCLLPGEEIGLEVHEEDQFFRIEKGEAMIEIEGDHRLLGEGEAALVPAGAEHNLVNAGDDEVKLYTIYAPAHHPEGTVHPTKEDTLIAEASALPHLDPEG